MQLVLTFATNHHQFILTQTTRCSLWNAQEIAHFENMLGFRMYVIGLIEISSVHSFVQ